MTHIPFTRRQFLKAAGGALALAPIAVPRIISARSLGSAADALLLADATPRRPLGRPIWGGVPIRKEATTRSVIVARTVRNQTINLLAQKEGTGTYNKIWYQTDKGWVHSGYIQPVDNKPQTAADAIPQTGAWGELSVPASAARASAAPKAYARYWMYYGCTFKVLALVSGADGKNWYRISDGNIGPIMYLPAEHVRVIDPAEFAPLSPDVPAADKRIEVNLRTQVVTAFEADKAVFAARCASGVAPHGTSRGNFRILLKLPGQRMTGGTAGDADFYDLPGISWVSYFTGTGIAFHGCYWHNDWGAPHSHGCVNLDSDDAKWIYRWTMPEPKYDMKWLRPGPGQKGTAVKVF